MLNIKLWVIDFSVLMIVGAVGVGLVKIALTRQISVGVDRPVRGAARRQRVGAVQPQLHAKDLPR